MDKEEILKKSRAQKEDEGEREIENLGNRYTKLFLISLSAFCLLFATFVTHNVREKEIAWMILTVYYAGDSLAKFRVTKKKSQLIWFLIMLLTFIFTVIDYIKLN